MTNPARKIVRRQQTARRKAEQRLARDHTNNVGTDKARDTYSRTTLPYWRR